MEKLNPLVDFADPDERERYEAQLKWLRDEEMALKKAESKGMAKGLKEGLAQSQEMILAIAQKLRNKGLSTEDIMDSTGLSLAEISQLDK